MNTNTPRVLRFSILALCLAAGIATARAVDTTKTVTGEAKCAMKDLGTSTACQTVVQVKEGEKTVDYYVADNKVAKDFHATICGHPQKVTATGTVATVDGKKELTATKIAVEK